MLWRVRKLTRPKYGHEDTQSNADLVRESPHNNTISLVRAVCHTD